MVRKLARLDPTPWMAASAGVAVIGGALVAIGTAEVQIDPSHPALFSNGWFRLGIVILIVGALILLTAITIALSRWCKRRKTPLAITHQSADEECVEWGSGSEPHWQQVRVRVTADEFVQNVRLRMVSRKPLGRKFFMWLMHDNIPQHPRSMLGELCTPEVPLCFNIALHHPHNLSSVLIDFADEGLRGISAISITSTVQQHWFQLEATGRRDDGTSVRPAREWFRLDITRTGELSLVADSPT